MPPPLTFEYTPLSYAYPDDESDKELCFQAPGTSASASAPYLRTVLLYWVNTVFPDGEEVWQVVRLDRRDEPHDTHKYVYPDMIVVDGSAERDSECYTTISLGVFTRDQRETVLECAENVEYEARPRAGDEGQGARWMSELLERMVGEGLVARGVVDTIREVVPLPPPPSLPHDES